MVDSDGQSRSESISHLCENMKVPERFRLKTGIFASTEEYGNNGHFIFKKKNTKIHCIASDGEGWDHVSTTLINKKRTPTWEEMCYVKDLFFNENECVIQFHPVKGDYVDNHKYCLHLWRPQTETLPKPSIRMV